MKSKYIQIISFKIASYIMLLALVSADTPEWTDNPGGYVNTATLIGSIVKEDGVQLGNEGDLFAAFDDAGNVRGVAIMLNPPFGPYAGTPVFEMTMRSNAEGDVFYFQYYDALEDAVKTISETYTFVINDQVGDVIDPVIFNVGAVGALNNSDRIFPLNYILDQNYPNPYNPKTLIKYSIPRLSDVTLEVFDIRGNLIIELLHKIHSPGEYKMLWDAGNMPSGLYFLDMKVYSKDAKLIFRDTNKMLYLK